MVDLVISFPSEDPKSRVLQIWKKRLVMQRVPSVGEVIWVHSMEDYVVTDVSWDAETGSATVLCEENEPSDPDWIENLESSGFVKLNLGQA